MIDLEPIEQAVKSARASVEQSRAWLRNCRRANRKARIRLALCHFKSGYWRTFAACRRVSGEIRIQLFVVFVGLPFLLVAFALLIFGLLGAPWSLVTLELSCGFVAIFLLMHLLCFPTNEALGAVLEELPLDESRLSELRAQQFEALKTARIGLQNAESKYDTLQKELRDAQIRLEQIRQRDDAARLEWLRSQRYELEQLFQENWRALRDVEFEEYLKRVFEKKGIGVETTKRSGDQGVDLIVTFADWRIAFQVKGYGNPVGNKAVQEAYTGMSFYNCNGCAVVTNSQFAKPARQLADGVGCRLIDGDQMCDLVVRNLLDELFPAT